MINVGVTGNFRAGVLFRVRSVSSLVSRLCVLVSVMLQVFCTVRVGFRIKVIVRFRVLLAYVYVSGLGIVSGMAAGQG